jgi:hypothetical protein
MKTRLLRARLLGALALVPKLLFGNALLETPVSRVGAVGGRILTRNRSFADGVPKQEFGNEEKRGKELIA